MICSVCGCTPENPCVNADGDECEPVSDSLCSFCADEVGEDEDFNEFEEFGESDEEYGDERE